MSFPPEVLLVLLPLYDVLCLFLLRRLPRSAAGIACWFVLPVLPAAVCCWSQPPLVLFGGLLVQLVFWCMALTVRTKAARELPTVPPLRPLPRWLRPAAATAWCVTAVLYLLLLGTAGYTTPCYELSPWLGESLQVHAATQEQLNGINIPLWVLSTEQAEPCVAAAETLHAEPWESPAPHALEWEQRYCPVFPWADALQLYRSPHPLNLCGQNGAVLYAAVHPVVCLRPCCCMVWLEPAAAEETAAQPLPAVYPHRGLPPWLRQLRAHLARMLYLPAAPLIVCGLWLLWYRRSPRRAGHVALWLLLPLPLAAVGSRLAGFYAPYEPLLIVEQLLPFAAAVPFALFLLMLCRAAEHRMQLRGNGSPLH